jgi:hypothetical protein
MRGNEPRVESDRQTVSMVGPRRVRRKGAVERGCGMTLPDIESPEMVDLLPARISSLVWGEFTRGKMESQLRRRGGCPRGGNEKARQGGPYCTSNWCGVDGGPAEP